MIIKDGWKLTGTMRWEPVEWDVKETCNSCLGRGKSEYDWDNNHCTECGGNGFRIVCRERGKQPDVPEHLAQWMRDAYKEWGELYGSSYT